MKIRPNLERIKSLYSAGFGVGEIFSFFTDINHKLKRIDRHKDGSNNISFDDSIALTALATRDQKQFDAIFEHAKPLKDAGLTNRQVSNILTSSLYNNADVLAAFSENAKIIAELVSADNLSFIAANCTSPEVLKSVAKNREALSTSYKPDNLGCIIAYANNAEVMDAMATYGHAFRDSGLHPKELENIAREAKTGEIVKILADNADLLAYALERKLMVDHHSIDNLLKRSANPNEMLRDLRGIAKVVEPVERMHELVSDLKNTPRHDPELAKEMETDLAKAERTAKGQIKSIIRQVTEPEAAAAIPGKQAQLQPGIV